MSETKQSPITCWLDRSSASVFSFYVMTCAFTTYFCMYAFRKPFTAAEYTDIGMIGPFDYKTVLVISQIIGYTLSKYIGIKVCSEIKRNQRAFTLVLLILIAEAALFLFAVLPTNFKIFAIFFTGLPLGMVWGIAVLYLEGRTLSEILLAGLSCSYIVSSGVVKDVGRWLMSSYNVTEFWMPFMTGLVFLPLFFLSVWLLNQTPNPTEIDEDERVKRQPMDAQQRWKFFITYLPGIVMLLVAYFFITAYRDIRDVYGIEVFTTLGYGETPAIFTRTELPIAFGIMVVYSALSCIHDNRRGLIALYGIMVFGTMLMGISTLLFQADYIDGIWWMILIGFGAYLAYVPYGSILFDRTIASTHFVGTAVFAIYMADAFGYTGSVSIQMYQNLVAVAEVDWKRFLIGFTYVLAVVATVLQGMALMYFLQKSEEPVLEVEEQPA